MFRCRIESDLDDLAALDEVAEEDGEADDAHAGEAPAPDYLSIHLQRQERNTGADLETLFNIISSPRTVSPCNPSRNLLSRTIPKQHHNRCLHIRLSITY